MLALAVGRLHHDDVDRLALSPSAVFGIAEERAVGPAEVARDDDAALRALDLDARRAEDVPGLVERERQPGDVDRAARTGPGARAVEALEERRRPRVATRPACRGCPRARASRSASVACVRVDGAVEAALEQRRHVADVVEVAVREDERRRRRARRRGTPCASRPCAMPQSTSSRAAAHLDARHRAGDLPDGAEQAHLAVGQGMQLRCAATISGAVGIGAMLEHHDRDGWPESAPNVRAPPQHPSPSRTRLRQSERS